MRIAPPAVNHRSVAASICLKLHDEVQSGPIKSKPLLISQQIVPKRANKAVFVRCERSTRGTTQAYNI